MLTHIHTPSLSLPQLCFSSFWRQWSSTFAGPYLQLLYWNHSWECVLKSLPAISLMCECQCKARPPGWLPRHTNWLKWCFFLSLSCYVHTREQLHCLWHFKTWKLIFLFLPSQYQPDMPNRGKLESEPFPFCKVLILSGIMQNPPPRSVLLSVKHEEEVFYINLSH